MSFDGYYEILCEHGHRSTKYVYDRPFVGSVDVHPWACPHCNGVEAWRRLVDTTNGDPDDVEELVVFKEAVVQECSLGHKHEVDLAFFKAASGKWNIKSLKKNTEPSPKFFPFADALAGIAAKGEKP